MEVEVEARAVATVCVGRMQARRPTVAALTRARAADVASYSSRGHPFISSCARRGHVLLIPIISSGDRAVRSKSHERAQMQHEIHGMTLSTNDVAFPVDIFNRGPVLCLLAITYTTSPASRIATEPEARPVGEYVKRSMQHLRGNDHYLRDCFALHVLECRCSETRSGQNFPPQTAESLSIPEIRQ